APLGSQKKTLSRDEIASHATTELTQGVCARSQRLARRELCRVTGRSAMASAHLVAADVVTPLGRQDPALWRAEPPGPPSAAIAGSIGFGSPGTLLLNSPALGSTGHRRGETS